MRRFSFWPRPYWYRRWHSTRCACPPPWPRGGLGQAGCARFAPGAGQCSERWRCGCARRRTAGPAGSSTSRLCSGGFRRSRSVLRWRRRARRGPSASPGPHPSVPPRPRAPDQPVPHHPRPKTEGTSPRPPFARRRQHNIPNSNTILKTRTKKTQVFRSDARMHAPPGWQRSGCASSVRSPVRRCDRPMTEGAQDGVGPAAA